MKCFMILMYLKSSVCRALAESCRAHVRNLYISLGIVKLHPSSRAKLRGTALYD